MEKLKARWLEMDLYRWVLLAVMAAEIVGFLIASVIAANRPGLEYGGTLLYPRTEGELQVYEGKIDGEPARFAVSPEGEVSCQWGEYAYGPYQVAEDPSAVPEGVGSSALGVEISQDGAVLFRGAYYLSFLVPEEGGGAPQIEMEIHADGTVIGADGRVLTQAELHEPALSAVARIALAPELTHRGSVGLYLAVTLLALVNILQICFPGFFFRLSLWGHVRNVEAAEPSDFYIVAERLEWLILALACLFLYWRSAAVIV